MEFRLINYNLVNEDSPMLRTLIQKNSFDGNMQNLQRRGKNRLILKTMHKSPIPLQGWIV